MERQRDKNWFFKIQQLEKKSQGLREKMELISKKHNDLILETQKIIAKSNDINQRFIQRRNEEKLTF